MTPRMTPKYGKAKLDEGARYEQFVHKIVNPWGLTFWVNNDPIFQQTKGESLQGCEVKLDEGCVKYGHLSIEIAEKSHADNPTWVASGICKEDNSWAYIQGNYEKVFVFSKKWLLRYLAERNPPIHEYGGTVRKFHLPDHNDGLDLAMKAALFVLNGEGKRLDDGQPITSLIAKDACTICGKPGANETWTCDPGGEPVHAWLHRDCEAAFLKRLDAA